MHVSRYSSGKQNLLFSSWFVSYLIWIHRWSRAWACTYDGLPLHAATWCSSCMSVAAWLRRSRCDDKEQRAWRPQADQVRSHRKRPSSYSNFFSDCMPVSWRHHCGAVATAGRPLLCDSWLLTMMYGTTIILNIPHAQPAAVNMRSPPRPPLPPLKSSPLPATSTLYYMILDVSTPAITTSSTTWVPIQFSSYRSVYTRAWESIITKSKKAMC